MDQLWLFAFIAPLMGGLFNGFIQSLFNFVLRSFLTEYTIDSRTNHVMSINLGKHVMKNRFRLQGKFFRLKFNSSMKEEIKNQEYDPKNGGITLFWIGHKMAWVTLGKTFHRGINVTEYNICTFRFWSADMTKLLNQLSETTESSVKLYTLSNGDWDRGYPLFKKTGNSMVDDHSNYSKILEHTMKFKNSKEEYHKMEKHYRYTCLFSGIPGVGKTSNIYRLAHDLGCNVYQIPFNQLGETSLLDLTRDMEANSILLLDDFDGIEDLDGDSESYSEEPKMRSRRSQRARGQGLMKELQSILDGINSPNNGMIICIITNNREKLGPILTRPGRIQLEIEYTYASNEWIKGMFIQYYPTEKQEADRLVGGLKKYDVTHSHFKLLIDTFNTESPREVVNHLISELGKPKQE